MPLTALPDVIIIDSREQTPLVFEERISIQIKALHAGDYTTPKLEGRAACERKTSGDFLGTFFSDKERRDRQLDRLASLSRRAIVVEASFEEVLELRGRVHPHALVGTVASLTARHKCPVVFIGNRTLAARFVVGCLGRWESIAA